MTEAVPGFCSAVPGLRPFPETLYVLLSRERVSGKGSKPGTNPVPAGAKVGGQGAVDILTDAPSRDRGVDREHRLRVWPSCGASGEADRL